MWRIDRKVVGERRKKVKFSEPLVEPWRPLMAIPMTMVLDHSGNSLPPSLRRLFLHPLVPRALSSAL